MKKHLKIILVLVVAMLFMPFVVGQRVVAGTSPLLTQRILPLQCVVSTIETGGLTTLTYSPACGESVMPPAAPSTSGNTPPTLAPSFPVTGNEPPASSGGGTSELISDNPAIYSPWGLTLVVKEGMQYRFYLEGDNVNDPPRGLLIVRITEKGLFVRLVPGSVTQGLVVGDRAELDLNGDGIADMRLHLMAVDTNRGVGVLRVVLYHQISSDQTVIEKWYQQVILAGLFIGIAGGVHFYHRRKIPYLHHHWKAPHSYHTR